MFFVHIWYVQMLVKFMIYFFLLITKIKVATIFLGLGNPFDQNGTQFITIYVVL